MPGWDPSVHPPMGGIHERVPISLRAALSRGNALLDLSARDLGECFQRAIAAFELPVTTDRQAVLNAIREREQLCSTALGNGFALPHTRRTGARLVAANIVGFVRLRTPVPADSMSSVPVDLLFFIFARDPTSHLRLLSRAARLAQEASLARTLRAARQPRSLLRAIAQAERRLFPPRPVGSVRSSRNPRQPRGGEVGQLPEGKVTALVEPASWDRLRATYAKIWRDWEAGPRPEDPTATDVARLVWLELQRGSGTPAARLAAARPEGQAPGGPRDYAARALQVVVAQRPRPTAIVFEQVRRSLEDAGVNRLMAWRLCLALRRTSVIAGDPNRPYLGRRAQLMVGQLLAEVGFRAQLVEDLEAGLMIAAERRLVLAGQRVDAEVLTEACSQLARASTTLLRNR